MLEKFLATKVEIRPSTRIQYQASINHIKEHPLADRPLQKAGVLDVEDCRKFLYDQVDSGRLSMSTIREDLSFLCSAFTWAADVDLIYKSPARRLKLPPKTKPQGIHTPVENIMEILRIVKIESYDTLYIPLLLAGFCGLRISEICGIQLDKISADGIKVENNLCRVRNKPGVVNPDGTVSKVQLAPLKTESSYRTGPGTTAKVSSENPLNTFIQKELNQWAQNNLKGVDLSFGIDSHGEDDPNGQRTDYSYRLSKNLFNNRVRAVIGGKFSTDADPSQNLKENLIDDISLEYMLTKRDNMYLKVFRHTGYESILEGEITETGVGFVIRKKLSRLGDLFKPMRPKTKKPKK